MSENKQDALQDEMQELAETFQSEYDKAAAEAEEHPVIQELDEIVEEDDEDDEEPEETDEPEKKKSGNKKDGKKRLKSVLSTLSSLLFILVLMLVTAAIAFYASAYTDFDSYIYSMKCAESVENADTKISYYEEALGYLKGDNVSDKMASLYEDEMQKVHELITVSTVDKADYATAMTYMHTNLTQDQIASPQTAEFKAFLKIAGVFETLAEDCVEKIETNGTDADMTALAAAYTDNETLRDDIADILQSVAAAVAAEDKQTAATNYKAAIDGLAAYSTFSQVLTEHYVICLAQAEGYAAALEYANTNLTDEQLASPVVSEFATFNGVADILAGLSDTICITAKELVGDSATAPTDFEPQINALNAPAYVHDELNTLFDNVANGFAKINSGSYSSAVTALTAAADSFAGYGCAADSIMEYVTIATAYANGYAAALAYADENLGAQDYEPKTEEYTAFLAAENVFETLDENQYKAVAAAVDGMTNAATASIDLSELVSSLILPECLQAEAQAMLTNLGRAMICENNGKKEDALNYYTSLNEDFEAIGVAASYVLEKIAVLTKETKDLHAAYVFVNEHPDALAFTAENAITTEFAALLTTLDGAFSEDKVASFISNAKKALEENDYNDVDIAAVVSKSGIDASVADFYKAYYAPLAAALKAENDKNLNLAIAEYEKLIALLTEDGIVIPVSVREGIITAAFNAGDMQTAFTHAETLNVDDLSAGEFKTLCETVLLCRDAMETATGVFQQAYYSSYYGTVPARDELNAQFDSLLTEESNKYHKAFNYYYRYVCEMYFFSSEEGSADRQIEYLEKVREQIPELIFVYGYNLIDYFISDGNFDEAKKLAEDMIAINAYDDVALSLLAKLARIDGDLAKAKAYVEKGVAYENDLYESEREHIIICMLNGNLADAYDSVVALYDRGLSTMFECETIAVFNALYKDATAEQTTKLNEIMNHIETELYAASGYTFSENTQAIINGTKTADDVFLAEPYDLW